MRIIDDKELETNGESIIEGLHKSQITNIGYDLTCDKFIQEPGQEVNTIALQPGMSAFVKTAESVKLPNDMIATVNLRNSRIRQGLTLDAPVYQPGHYTKVFFRVTNVSNDVIELKTNDSIAMIMFIKLDEPVKHPYNGKYQNEE